MSPMDPLPALIRAARGWANLSQKELADRLEVSDSWVKRREKGADGVAPRDRIAIERVCDVEFTERGIIGKPYSEMEFPSGRPSFDKRRRSENLGDAIRRSPAARRTRARRADAQGDDGSRTSGANG